MIKLGTTRKIIISTLIALGVLMIALLGISCFWPINDVQQRSDLIICLGGNAIHRQEKTLDLYNENYAQKLLLINQFPYYFLKNGVSSSNIYITNFPASTFGDAQYCRKFMGAYNVDSAIVVSDWWHLRRVKWSFETVFKGTEKRLIYVPSYAPGVGIWWYLQPHRIRLVSSEWVKLVGYWVIHSVNSKQ